MEVKMSFISYLINGVSLGSIYAIIALGYTMVYGIAKMLNFAHGDVIMIGCYIVFVLMGSFHLNSTVSIIAAVIGCTVLGVVIEKIAYKPLKGFPACRINHSNRCQLFSAELRINFIWCRYKVLYIGCKYPYN